MTRAAETLKGILRDFTWPENLTAADERELLDLAAEHRILPLLHERLRDAPTAVHEELRLAAFREIALEEFRLAALRRFLDLTQEAGIPVLLFKGSALAYQIYAAAALRPRVDTDVAVSRRDYARLCDVLERAGYEQRVSAGGDLASMQSLFWSRDPRHPFDIHRSIINAHQYSDLFPFDELYARAEPIAAIHPAARALSRPDALAVAAVHRVVHHHDSESLLWLHDIALLRDRMSDAERERLWSFAQERRIDSMVGASIRKASETFGMRVPEAALSSTFRSPRTRLAWLRAEFAALPDWNARLRWLSDLAFPPREFMFESYSVSSRALLPLLYLHRGVRGVARLFRRPR